MRNNLYILAFFIGFISSFNVYSADTGIPIIDAVIDGDISKVEQLISNKVDVNQTDVCGRTAIMYAYDYGKENMKDLIIMLIEAGSDDIVSVNGEHVIRAGVFDDDFISPVYFAHCFLGKHDPCSDDVSKKAHKIIIKELSKECREREELY